MHAMVAVRPATEEDLRSILAIFNDVIETSTAVYAWKPVDLAERRSWFSARSQQNFPVLVAVGDNQDIIGFSSYGEWRGPWPGYRYTVEHTVHVRADWRRRGVGRILVEALFPIALAQHKHVMIGSIDAQNEASIRFHQKLGFDRVAYFREVGHKFDRWLDLVFVQRLLDDSGAPRSH
jgi:L-amino acid N-acyltransferase